MEKGYKDLLIFAGIILAIIATRYLWKKTPTLGGGSASNEERWKLIRNSEGIIDEIVVYRNVKE